MPRSQDAEVMLHDLASLEVTVIKMAQHDHTARDLKLNIESEITPEDRTLQGYLG